MMTSSYQHGEMLVQATHGLMLPWSRCEFISQICGVPFVLHAIEITQSEVKGCAKTQEEHGVFVSWKLAFGHGCFNFFYFSVG
jgi:hypothetical protein